MIQQTTQQMIADARTADPLLTAMHLIEQASELLIRAGAEINLVPGTKAEYTRACNAHERVHYLLGKVRDRRLALREKALVPA